MKKCIALILAILLLTGCAAPASTPSAATEDPSGTTTVMIYMIGSDLEAQAGAASRDLQEILDSGVDPERVNVVIYAGGSPHWHNEHTDAENHTLLQLTAEGYTQVTAIPTASMGEAACLTNFLTYAHNNFPADDYALILWDHGDGPVIGYGRDMLFDNDTLTLLEMRQALEASPFREKKLSWVGFDACLMASAELSCVWADYADYLVASQEVEPAFGWDYSFLRQAGSVDTVTLLQNLTEQYLQTCLAYYEDRGYEHRDTTLSCVDLSYGDALSEAVNALFAAAEADTQANYSAITARRVQARALGRATTGSEYDLVDLTDLARQFEDIYPDQSRRLLTVLQEMILSNSSNAENCSGLSLYYPFYNKYYFEDSWGARYQELGVFTDYLDYLTNYQTVWLSNDLLENASSVMPQQTLTGTYTLQLTEEQQESFASAKYYILVRDGEEYFTRIFVSPDVTNEDGLLTAGFDGNVLYVKDNYGNYQIPVTIAHDEVGNQSRYSVFVTLANYHTLGLLSLPDDFHRQMQAHRFSLTLNQETGQVSVTSLVPYDHSTDSAVLTGGKLEDANLSDWASCFFIHDDHRYLSRYENGAVMPVDQWPVSTLFSGYEYPVEDGLEFVSAPLAAGEYYLLFEVEDTQGNRYCSELLPIDTTGTLPQPEAATPIDRNWSQGDKVLLTDRDGVTVFLCKYPDSDGTEAYWLEATNANDYTVRITAHDLFWNNEIFCDSYFTSVTVSPGQTALSDYGKDLDTADELGILSASGQLQFSLSIQNELTGAHLMYAQPFSISISENTRCWPDMTIAEYNRFHTPVLGALAQEQLLLETPQTRVTLLGLGGNDRDSTLRGAVCIENLSDQPLTLSAEGLVLNGVYVTLSTDRSDIPAHSRAYHYFSTLNHYMELSGITSVETAQLLLKERAYSPLFTGNTPTQLYWCDIALTQSAPASQFTEGTQVLFEENGIRVCVSGTKNEWSTTTWLLTLVNDSDQDIALKLADVHINGEAVQPGESSAYTNHAKVGAHQRCAATLDYYEQDAPLESVTFRFRIMTFAEDAIIFTGTESITLNAP